LQIWEKAGTFEPLLGSAFHWALSIARHRAIDRLRARQRRARLMEEFNNLGMADTKSEAGPGQGGLRADEAAAIRAAVNDLPGEQRQAIEMAFFGGKTHAEIAEALNEPLGTIKARIRRGMLRLRDTLQTCA
jgi:RNA polymerase sigma-70 factor (ECF subfamily)